MINNLQFLRAFAALSVVFYHTGYTVNGISTEFQGVAIFFAISGFIMTHISRESSDSFLKHRLIRIVPLYWITTIFFVIVTNLGLTNPLYMGPVLIDWITRDPLYIFHWLSTQNGITNQVDQIPLIKSLFFIPYVDGTGVMHPILGVGWTLNLEMFFYLLFALGLRINRGVAPVLVAATLLSIRAFQGFPLGNENTLATFYGHPYMDCFVLGIVAYYIWRYFPFGLLSTNRFVLFFLVAFGLAVVSIFVMQNTNSLGWVKLAAPVPLEVFGYVSPGLMLLLALFTNSMGWQVKSRFILLLGDSSYAIYLTHSIVVEMMRTVGGKIDYLNQKTNLDVVFFVLIIVSLVSIAVFLFVEKPIMKFLRKRLC